MRYGAKKYKGLNNGKCGLCMKRCPVSALTGYAKQEFPANPKIQ
jgi:ferredoxin